MKRILFLAIVSSLFFFQTSNGWAHVQGYEGFKAGHSKTPGPSQLKQIKKAQRQSPLRFEVNRGQTDPAVRFLARGPGYNLFLTPTESVLTLSSPKVATVPERKKPHRPKDFLNEPPMQKPLAPQEFDTSVVRMHLSGANPAPKMHGEQKLPGVTNYLKGNDKSKWTTDIESYARVRYEDVYPGVDLVYYGKGSQLEYDFIVQPGTDPKAIQLSFEGVERYSIEGGDLILHTALGPLVQKAPVIYQDINGQRRTVDGNYAFLDDGIVSFYLRGYDKTQPLVIDPLLSWSTYLGGDSFDNTLFQSPLKVNSLGQLVVVGSTGSADFPVTDLTELGGDVDPFVALLDSDGSTLIFATYLGGSDSDFIRFFDLNSLDDIYIAGSTSSDDFPLAGFSFENVLEGPNDIFIARLSPSTGALVWSTYLGGDVSDILRGFLVHPSGGGGIVAIGQTSSSDFPVLNAFQPGHGGVNDVFVTRLNSDGTGVFSTFLGGNASENPWRFKLSAAGEIFITGITSSANFPTNGPIASSYGGGTQDIFVTKFTSAGFPIFSIFLGGSDREFPSEMILMESSPFFHTKIIIAGGTRSPDFPTINSFQPFGGGNQDGFLTVINTFFNSPGGAIIPLSTFLGGSDDEWVNGLGIDAQQNIYVAGGSSSSDFPAFKTFKTSCKLVDQCHAIFINKLGTTPSNAFNIQLFHSTLLLSEGIIPSFEMKVDAPGNAYLFGYVDGDEERIQTTPKAFQKNCTPFPGDPLRCEDGFITKFNPNGSPVFSTYLGGSDAEEMQSLEVDPLGNILVFGITGGDDFPTTSNAVQPAFGGFDDIFLTKFSPNGKLAYSSYFGGIQKDEPTGMALGSGGAVFMAGRTWSPDFPTLDPIQSDFASTSAGLSDVFVAGWIDPQVALADLQSEVDALGLPGKFPKKLKGLLKKAGKLLSDPKSKNDLKGLGILLIFMQMVKAENGGELVFEDADFLLDLAQRVLEAQFHTLLIQFGGEGDDPPRIVPLPGDDPIQDFIDDIEGLGLGKASKKLTKGIQKMDKLLSDGNPKNDSKAVGLFFKFFKTVDKLTPKLISEVNAEFLRAESSELFHRKFHGIIPRAFPPK